VFREAQDAKKAINDALDCLDAKRWIRLVTKRTTPRGGRPSIDGIVNSRVFE
jgi:hypothetical protein